MSRMRAFVFLFLTAGNGAVSGCSGGGEHDVLAIARTRTYHTRNCPPVHMAKTVLMTAARAESLHYSPCPICKPNQE